MAKKRAAKKNVEGEVDSIGRKKRKKIFDDAMLVRLRKVDRECIEKIKAANPALTGDSEAVRQALFNEARRCQ